MDEVNTGSARSEPALTPQSRAWRRLPWLLFAAVALGAGAYVGHRWLAPTPGTLPDAAIFGVTLPDLDGKPVSLATYRGKPLVLNFWASWCGPCREEMPAFVRMQSELGPNAVQFVGIGVDSADKLRDFAATVHLNYPALVGGYGALELSRGLGNDAMALPFTLVVNRDGAVVHRELGPLAPDKLRNLLAQMH
ncbi:MAG: redoxin family protein [Proteobacteria bacterium]|nr:redoxin family protein [Pseudomonadota bacterium]